MMDLFMLKAAIAIMFIIIIREVLRKRFSIDMDKIDVKDINRLKDYIKNFKNTKIKPIQKPQTTNSELKTVILKDAGPNKATVMATLRQITQLDYNTAKNLVNSTPSTLISNIPEKEANLTKSALEFVGATVEVK